MPREFQYTQGQVRKNSTLTMPARVVGDDGTVITQAECQSIAYSIAKQDKNFPDETTPVTGHTGVALTPANVVYNTLQNDDLWDGYDDEGYNFAFTPDISVNQAFAERGATYVVDVTITPTAGQAIALGWKLECV